jgi:hypothetical protein
MLAVPTQLYHHEKIPLWFQHRIDRPDLFARAKYKERYKWQSFLLVSLNPTKTGEFVARKVIRKDAREEFKRLYGGTTLLTALRRLAASW